MEHLKSASVGYAPSLLTNIRLDWKGLPGTKAVAYYQNLKITAVKSFTLWLLNQWHYNQLQKLVVHWYLLSFSLGLCDLILFSGSQTQFSP